MELPAIHVFDSVSLTSYQCIILPALSNSTQCQIYLKPATSLPVSEGSFTLLQPSYAYNKDIFPFLHLFIYLIKKISFLVLGLRLMEQVAPGATPHLSYPNQWAASPISLAPFLFLLSSLLLPLLASIQHLPTSVLTCEHLLLWGSCLINHGFTSGFPHILQDHVLQDSPLILFSLWGSVGTGVGDVSCSHNPKKGDNSPRDCGSSLVPSSSPLTQPQWKIFLPTPIKTKTPLRSLLRELRIQFPKHHLI